jgi:stalled ribosome rescue protein Dom34
MQISKNLPQFESKTLIIVSGIHEAHYFTAHQGSIEEIHKFETKKITYSDREGHFLKSAFGKVFGSGSVYERPKEQELIEFAGEFEKQSKKLIEQTKPENIILACPDYAENLITNRLSKDARDKINLVINGNYHKIDAVKLLKIIQKEQYRKKPSTEVISEEAKKILKKGR